MNFGVVFSRQLVNLDIELVTKGYPKLTKHCQPPVAADGLIRIEELKFRSSIDFLK